MFDCMFDCMLNFMFHGMFDCKRGCSQVRYILDEIVQGGMVVETSIPDILLAVNECNALAAAR